MEKHRDSEYIQVIVVDDEMIGADDVRDLIQERFGEEQKVVARVAYNARTVLKMAEETPCDILVTDIQMPGMDGLALAKEMRRLYGDIAILFLTGYDDFSYAYEAFKYNAERYLLKTDGDEEILRAVGEAIRGVREQRQILQRIYDSENRYSQMLPAYRRQIVMQLLTENAEAASAEEAGFADERFYVVVARIGEAQKGANMRVKLIAASAISQIVENAVDGALRWSTSYVIDGELVWVFAMDQKTAYAGILFHLMRQARRHVEEQLRLPLFFVVADRDVDWAQLADQYHEIRASLARDILQGSTGVAIHNSAGEERRYDESHIRRINALRMALEACQKDVRNGQIDGLAAHADPVIGYLREASPADTFATELYCTLNGCLLNYLNRNGISRLATECERYRNFGEAEYLKSLIGQIEKQSTAYRDNAVKSVAEYVRNYIQSHISEDISTGVLAEVTGYSSGYLSRVFRQEYGMSIHEYVTDARMTLAKDLLRNTNLRVYEIASHCGYDNPTYFIKVFKAFTGDTPQDYKQQAAPT